MAWIYESSSGAMYHPNGKRLGYGFAGHGEGLNDPTKQNVRGVGPLPEHLYKMGRWIEKHDDMGLGVITLIPWAENGKILNMFARDGFAIHGSSNLFNSGLDKFLHSSDGCIIIGDLALRRQIWLHDDDFLQVYAKIPLTKSSPLI